MAWVVEAAVFLIRFGWEPGFVSETPGVEQTLVYVVFVMVRARRTNLLKPRSLGTDAVFAFISF